MEKPRRPGWIGEAGASLRVAAVSMIVLGGLYPALIGGLGRMAAPGSAAGRLIRDASGAVVGSELIGQDFRRPGYFWPRPSAVAYDASAAAGSNLPPASPELAERVRRRIADMGGTREHPVPIDLLAASGSGLDPHISLAAAAFQADRVASARGLPADPFREWLREWTEGRPEGRRRDPLVNVLLLNLAMDQRYGRLGPPAERGEAR